MEILTSERVLVTLKKKKQSLDKVSLNNITIQDTFVVISKLKDLDQSN